MHSELGVDSGEMVSLGTDRDTEAIGDRLAVASRTAAWSSHQHNPQRLRGALLLFLELQVQAHARTRAGRALNIDLAAQQGCTLSHPLEPRRGQGDRSGRVKPAPVVPYLDAELLVG